MSVRDRIKLFDKSGAHNSKPNFVVPIRRTSGASPAKSPGRTPRSPRSPKSASRTPKSPTRSPAAKSSHKNSTPPISSASSFRFDRPVPDESEVPDSQMTSPQRGDLSPRIAEFQVIEEIEECEYYEIDAELMASLLEINEQTYIDHSILLNKPLFPKPCLYTE